MGNRCHIFIIEKLLSVFKEAENDLPLLLAALK